MKRPLLIEIDKSQAEWVVVAYLANDPEMLRVVRDHLDAHAVTGSLISGVPVERILEESALLGHLTDPQLIHEGREEHFPDFLDGTYSGFIPRTMTIRQMGKKSNHALNYDMGYRRFALENETPERDSKRICDGYYLGYPGIKNTFHASVVRSLEKDRTLMNCFGRKRRFLGQWGADLFKEAYSQIPQSTVVDIINKAYCKIYALEVPRHTFLPITQVHDSILVEAYYRDWEELWSGLHRIKEYMTPILEYNGKSFVIDTTFEAGYSWGEENMLSLPVGPYIDTIDEFKDSLERIERAA